MYSACAHFFFVFLLFNSYTAEIGLNWKELEELLNPKFDWEAAVQTALGTDDSLEEVCCLSLSRVFELS